MGKEAFRISFIQFHRIGSEFFIIGEVRPSVITDEVTGDPKPIKLFSGASDYLALFSVMLWR